MVLAVPQDMKLMVCRRRVVAVVMLIEKKQHEVLSLDNSKRCDVPVCERATSSGEDDFVMVGNRDMFQAEGDSCPVIGQEVVFELVVKVIKRHRRSEAEPSTDRVFGRGGKEGRLIWRHQDGKRST